ncbi:MAG: type VI secretion system baseplate subunit TssK [Candidatus Rokubacteria bacterium]|nr:type VI secretion system baseplate subunit TssK [Candidatus Rokubacteria bacterium]
MSAHDLPAPIQWHEGMLLAPQHFQQLALRQEELLHYHAMAIGPFHWGVRRLTLDQALLVSGTVRVLELDAVMPDGLVVSHLRGQGGELEVDLSGHVDEMKSRPVTVHLAVPVKKPGDGALRGDLARYDSIEGPVVRDDNTGDGELRIPRLKPRLSLLVTETPPQKYVSFPLARVAYRNETFGATDFVPPCLAVEMRSPVAEMCTGIARRLREKAMFLSDQMLSASMTFGSAMALDTKNTIENLVGGLPLFEAVLTTGAAHPFQLYLALCALSGNVAAVGRNQIPPVFNAYNHNDLRATFDQVRDFIARTIDEGIIESHTPYSFKLDAGVFSIPFDAMWLAGDFVIGARGRPGTTEKEVVAWMDEALIGSRTKLSMMREKRILGAGRKRVDRDGELLPTRGSVLFTVKSDTAFIEPDEILQITNTADPANALGPDEIVLYVKQR